MGIDTANRSDGVSRRDVLRASGTAAAGLAADAIAVRAWAAGTEEAVPVALVGCGGRGVGAAEQALATPVPARLVALADVFPPKLESARAALKRKHDAKVEAAPDRCFAGFDGYRKAIDAVGPGGVVLLATPPAFRPLHLEYAVEKGVHVFMEKSFAVDGPGVRRVLKAGEAAKAKNLKIAGGLMARHYKPLEEAIEQIHRGLIGDLVTCWSYRVHQAVGFTPKAEGESELAHQIRNYNNFTWLNGGFLLDWLIHNLDVCCWAKDAWPVSCQGQGGRQARTANDQLFDHYAVEYHFPDGTRLFAQGRHMNKCWSFFKDVIHGTKGSALLDLSFSPPKLFKGYQQTNEAVIWRHPGAAPNAYQVEHNLFFDAVRNDKPYNETERCARAALVGILGRMAAESGQRVTWDQALQSTVELAPGLDTMAMESEPPVKPGPDGKYPVATPGITKGY
jgi:predicted dehydrogenase